MSADSGMCYPMIIPGLGFGLRFLIGLNGEIKGAPINNVDRIKGFLMTIGIGNSKTIEFY